MRAPNSSPLPSSSSPSSCSSTLATSFFFEAALAVRFLFLDGKLFCFGLLDPAFDSASDDELEDELESDSESESESELASNFRFNCLRVDVSESEPDDDEEDGEANGARAMLGE